MQHHTTTPRTTTPRTTTPRTTTTAIAAAIIASVGAGLAGCGGSSSSAAGQYLTADQALVEYRAATEKLDLAPGSEWVDHPIVLAATDEAGTTQYYEAGVGAQQADLQWYCSWAGAALGGEGESRAAALDRLHAFEKLGVWKQMDDNGHIMFTRILSSAELGDLAELDAYVLANCS